MFSIIFFRLWYLQVLSGDHYLKQAQNNQVRDITVQAPRGEILDRNGQVLVDNRTALALQILPTELPAEGTARSSEFERLGHVFGMSPGPDREADPPADQGPAGEPGDARARRRLRPRLLPPREPGRFPGVTVQRVYVRNYPHGRLAAQIYGYVREVTEKQLKEPRYQGLQPGDQVGQSGIENTYDNVLRGTNGMTRVQVDAAGNPTGHILNQASPSRATTWCCRSTRGPAGRRAGHRLLQHAGRLRRDERQERPRSSGLVPRRPSTRPSSPSR